MLIQASSQLRWTVNQIYRPLSYNMSMHTLFKMNGFPWGYVLGFYAPKWPHVLAQTLGRTHDSQKGHASRSSYPHLPLSARLSPRSHQHSHITARTKSKKKTWRGSGTYSPVLSRSGGALKSNPGLGPAEWGQIRGSAVKELEKSRSGGRSALSPSLLRGSAVAPSKPRPQRGSANRSPASPSLSQILLIHM